MKKTLKNLLSLGIIIPNYNGGKLLEKNLPKIINEIIKLSNYQIEIIVVDDGSADRSVDIIKKLIEEYSRKLVRRPKMLLKKKENCGRQIRVNSRAPILKLIENQTNLGFASTVNRGVEEAKGELLVLLNTDVYPEEGFLDAILPHFKDPKVFAVGMMDKSIENGKIVRRGRGIVEWKRGFYVHKRGEVDKTDTDWVSGGSGVFRRSIWEKLGGFDEIYNPFYWEDIDLSFRAKKAGYKILFESKSKVVHEHKKGIIKCKYSSGYIKMISYRNQFLFVWKNVDNVKFFASHLLWLPYHLFRSVLSFDFLLIAGFFAALIKLRQILKSRYQIKKF